MFDFLIAQYKMKFEMKMEYLGNLNSYIFILKYLVSA